MSLYLHTTVVTTGPSTSGYNHWNYLSHQLVAFRKCYSLYQSNIPVYNPKFTKCQKCIKLYIKLKLLTRLLKDNGKNPRMIHASVKEISLFHASFWLTMPIFWMLSAEYRPKYTSILK